MIDIHKVKPTLCYFRNEVSTKICQTVYGELDPKLVGTIGFAYDGWNFKI